MNLNKKGVRTERKGKGEGRKIQRYKNTCYSYGFTFVVVDEVFGFVKAFREHL